MDKKEWWGLAICLALATVIRLFFLAQADIVTPDEAYNIRMGRDFAAGQPFIAFSADHRRQPFPVLLFGVASKSSSGSVRACRIASLSLGILTLLVLHGCVRKIGTAQEALTADLLYALSPFAIQYSLWAVNHALFNFFYMAWLLCMLQQQEDEGWRWPIFTGVLAWACYMSRAEGFIFAFLVSAFLLISPWKRSWRLRCISALVFLAVFMALSSPFLTYLRSQTGHWQFAFVNRDPGAWKNEWDKVGSVSVLSIASTYMRAFFELDKIAARIIPMAIWILTAFGISRFIARKMFVNTFGPCLLLFVLMPLTLYPWVNFEIRRYYPVLLLFLMMASMGMQQWLEWLQGPIARMLCWITIVVFFIPGYVSLHKAFAEEPVEQRTMGQWIQSHYATPRIILSPDARSCFYAGSSCAKSIPIAAAQAYLRQGKSFEQFIAEWHVQLVVADTRFINRYYPEFLFLLEYPGSPALRHATTLQEGNEKIWLWEAK